MVEEAAATRMCPVCGRLSDDDECPDDGMETVAAPSRSLARVGGLIGGRYRVTKRLGGGGFGEVYQALHTGTQEPVALKLMRAELQDQKAAVQRFTAEARTSAALRHPNTVRVFDFGTTPEGDLYLAMELLQGQALEDLLLANGRLEPSRAVRIAIQVLRSLHEAHSRGLVHRDLKPDNIFLCDIEGEHDFVKVIDFGIAKLSRKNSHQSATNSGIVIGTPHYMSPEQIRAASIDGRSDLYSLGVVLYQCLAGRVPFDAGSGLAIIMAHISDPPQPITEVVEDLDPDIAAIVMRALEKDADRRFASAAAMREALEAWQMLAAGPGQPPPLQPRPDHDVPVQPDEDDEDDDERPTTQLPRPGPADIEVPPEGSKSAWPLRIAGLAAILATIAVTWWAVQGSKQPGLSGARAGAVVVRDMRTPAPLVAAPILANVAPPAAPLGAPDALVPEAAPADNADAGNGPEVDALTPEAPDVVQPLEKTGLTVPAARQRAKVRSTTTARTPAPEPKPAPKPAAAPAMEIKKKPACSGTDCEI